jgi:lipid-binding SYLF domain-containing protein
MNAKNQIFSRVIASTATGAMVLLLLGVSWSQDTQNQNQNTTQSTQHSTQKVNPNNPPAKNPNLNPANESEIEKRVQLSARVLDSIMGVKDKAIPDKIMKDAKCVAVIPHTFRIALGFGGEHGKGVATCRTGHGWSGPAPIDITGGSWGLQIGGESVDLVLVVMNQQGMDNLLNDKFRIGATASGAAGPIGRDVSAQTSYKFNADVLTYSRAKGAFAGIDLSGAVINQDKDETRVLYGHMHPFNQILNGSVAPPKGTGSFVAAVTKYYERANGKKAAGSAGE